MPADWLMPTAVTGIRWRFILKYSVAKSDFADVAALRPTEQPGKSGADGSACQLSRRRIVFQPRQIPGLQMARRS